MQLEYRSAFRNRAQGSGPKRESIRTTHNGLSRLPEPAIGEQLEQADNCCDYCEDDRDDFSGSEFVCLWLGHCLSLFDFYSFGRVVFSVHRLLWYLRSRSGCMLLD